MELKCSIKPLSFGTDTQPMTMSSARLHVALAKLSTVLLGIHPRKPTASIGACVGQCVMQSIVDLIVGGHDLIVNCSVD